MSYLRHRHREAATCVSSLEAARISLSSSSANSCSQNPTATNEVSSQHAGVLPSTAINQLEMFQADTFDPKTIDRELGWAQSLGFNAIRVYLQDQLWQQDSQGFLARLDQFLAVAAKHGIGVLFVLFDSCW